MRPTFTVDLLDSLELAARKLREGGSGILPVTQDGFYSGAVTESSLASALSQGKEMTEPVEAIAQPALTASASTTGAEALRLFDHQNASALIVLDHAGRVLGIVTPSDLYPKRLIPPRPPAVGGMATPFGVYLTTGTIRAGVGHLALITTGMTLSAMLIVAQILTNLGSDWLTSMGISARVNLAVVAIAPYVIFLLTMRLIPLSGIHAAEHKVVHAIERGEELVPATVRRMPRVHPRCGTNLAVGASLFLSVALYEFIPSLIARLFIAAIVTVSLWRPLGSAMQRYVTTKRPTEKQIAMGIRSGRELLHKYATDRSGGVGVGMRIVNSGMLHVMAGGMVVTGLLYLIFKLFRLPDVVGLFEF